MKAAKSQASAQAREGERQAMSIADQTVRTAGSLRNSFLTSGLTLEGGPMDVIAQAFAKGRTDIGRAAENANAASKNTVSSARTKMLQNLGTTAAVAVGGFASDFGNGFEYGFDNAATLQTGATPGIGNTWVPPWQVNQPLPWKV